MEKLSVNGKNNSMVIGPVFRGYMNKNMQILRNGDILMVLLALTCAFTLFHQCFVSTHTLGPGALFVLQMMIFVNIYAEFFHLPLI